MAFKKLTGDWAPYSQAGDRVVDFHWSRMDGPRDYGARMAEVADTTLKALKEAHANGESMVVFIHGSSTSQPGTTTARSIVRTIMRSMKSTPYIIKAQCLQHETVFVAAI